MLLVLLYSVVCTTIISVVYTTVNQKLVARTILCYSTGMDKKRMDYINNFKCENLKRIGFEVKKDYYENILKPAADAAGESMNAFIKKAVQQRIEREK